MKRKHYDLIVAWANDDSANVQYLDDGCWHDIEFPGWHSSINYRLKPKTININGFEVPEPIYTRPDVEFVYQPDVCCGSVIKYSTKYVPDNSFEIGSCHLTEEAAQIHLDALMSFTKK